MKSFLEGRQSVSRTKSPTDTSSSRLPSLDRPPGDSTVPKMDPSASSTLAKREPCEKRIETVDIDGIIQKIIVTCGCGETIELHCGY